MQSPFVRWGLVAMTCLLSTACTKKEENPLDSGLSGNPLSNNLSIPSPSASPNVALPAARATDPFNTAGSLLGGMGEPKAEVAAAPRKGKKAAKRSKGKKRMKKGKHRRGNKARKKARRRRR